MKAKFAIILFLAVFTMSGCAYIQKAKRTDDLELENANLRNRLAQLEKEKTREVKKVYEQKDQELSELERAKRELEESLKKVDEVFLLGLR